MTNIENPEKLNFMLVKGRRDSARMAIEILEVLKEKLIGMEIKTPNGNAVVRLFIDVKTNDETGKPEFAFDVVGDFGHIEFFIKQTGWGGMI